MRRFYGAAFARDMRRCVVTAVTAAAVTVGSLPGGVMAQGLGDVLLPGVIGGVIAGGGSKSDGKRMIGKVVIGAATAVLISRQLKKVADQCKALGRAEYQIDCLGEGYTRVSRSIPPEPGYDEARAAIAKAGQQLTALARQNAATDLPPAGAKGRSRAIQPVSPGRLKATRKAAEKIIAQTQTVLLRSSERDPARKEPYRNIAAAMESGKVLIRSA